MSREPLILIDFHADWCGACKLLDPVLQRIAAADSDVSLRRVNVAEEPEVAERMRVSSLPTVIVVDAKNQERRRMSGSMTGSAILAALEDVRGQGQPG